MTENTSTASLSTLTNSTNTPSTDDASNPEFEACMFKDRWDEAIEICRKNLHPKSLEEIQRLNTYESLLEDFRDRDIGRSNEFLARVMSRITPALTIFQELAKFLILAMRGNYMTTAALWGIVHFLIQTSVNSTRVLTNVVTMLEDLQHSLQLLQLALPKDYAPGHYKDIDKVIVDIFVDIIMVWSKTAGTLSKNPLRQGMETAWGCGINWELEELSSRIKRKIQIVEATTRRFDQSLTSTVSRILASVEQLRLEDRSNGGLTGLGTHNDELPCHHMGFPENLQFFPRNGLLQIIRTELNHDVQNPKSRSMVLWGIGGVGKTQLALAYAYERKRDGLKLIFWINSETQDALHQSCTDICTSLKLDGAVSGGQHSRNHGILIKWLRKISMDFLMILDNVENFHVIKDTFVDSIHSSTLITTRYQPVSLFPIKNIIQVPSMSEVEGMEFLLNISKQSEHNKANADSATELSRLLDGLPLALTIMAMQILQRRMPLPRFLRFYKENQARLHGPEKDISLALSLYYRHDLATVFSLSFDSLQEWPKMLLRIISLLSPTDIPIGLFQFRNGVQLPPSLAFCANEWEFEEALKDLMSASLISKNPENEMISIHRVIQLEFRNKWSPDNRREYVKTAALLLLEGFPKQINGQSLRNHWSECSAYLQHVLSLIKHFEEFNLSPTTPEEFLPFVKCLSNVAWYLMESGAWERSEEVVRTGLKAAVDTESLLYAHLLNTAGCLRNKRNKSEEALKYHQNCMSIREKHLGNRHAELANCYNNMGLAFENGCQFDKALKSYTQAIEIDMAQPASEREKIMHIRYLNIANAHVQLGNYKEAENYIESGRQCAIRTFGKNTYYESIADYQLAQIHYRRAEYTEARDKLHRALEIQKRQNSRHQTTGATLFRLGCVELHDNCISQAEIYFEEALSIAEYNKTQKGDDGEIARIHRQMAELSFKKGNHEDGISLYNSAEAMRKKIQGPDWKADDNSEGNYDFLVACYYR